MLVKSPQKEKGTESKKHADSFVKIFYVTIQKSLHTAKDIQINMSDQGASSKSSTM